MKLNKIKAGWLVAAGLMCFAPTTFAACVPTAGTACMNLTGAGNNVMGGVYVGPD